MDDFRKKTFKTLFDGDEIEHKFYELGQLVTGLDAATATFLVTSGRIIEVDEDEAAEIKAAAKTKASEAKAKAEADAKAKADAEAANKKADEEAKAKAATASTALTGGTVKEGDSGNQTPPPTTSKP